MHRALREHLLRASWFAVASGSLAVGFASGCSSSSTSATGDAGDSDPVDAAGADADADAALLDPSDASSIPKFVTALPIPPTFVPNVVKDASGTVLRHEYVVDVRETTQQVLPSGYPRTKIWAYGAAARAADGTSLPTFRGWPSGTFEATRGLPVRVTWANALDGVSHMFPVDPTLHWADPNDAGMPTAPFKPYPPGYPSAQSAVPLVTHMHGAEVPSSSDGFPLAWVTADGRHGPAYASVAAAAANAQSFEYPNTQDAATLWYHDHALGLTRLNVLAGLAGFYLLRDPKDALAATMPSGAYEIPLAIQDRSFRADGSIAIDAVSLNPSVTAYWQSEYFGDVVTVNGASWPSLEVEPRSYRFRVLNGSNARFYDLSLVDGAGATLSFRQVGTEAGWLAAPVTLDKLLIAPGERADILVDFSGHAGATLKFVNDAPAPYPGGDKPNPATTGQVMQFKVTGGTPAPPPTLPATLVTIPTLVPDSPTRFLTLYEVDNGDMVPMIGALNGQMWDAPVSETPRVGSTEDWVVANLTEDAHPIHLHLVRFQLVDRTPFDNNAYQTDWQTLNGYPHGAMWPTTKAMKGLDPTPYFKGSPALPAANERGWKDTLVMRPYEVTRIRVRVAPISAPTNGPMAPAPGKNLFAFDSTQGPGYVWHCHILDHEDNEMMRPMSITP